jgi:hypothetical protein
MKTLTTNFIWKDTTMLSVPWQPEAVCSCPAAMIARFASGTSSQASANGCWLVTPRKVNIIYFYDKYLTHILRMYSLQRGP